MAALRFAEMRFRPTEFLDYLSGRLDPLRTLRRHRIGLNGPRHYAGRLAVRAFGRRLWVARVPPGPLPVTSPPQAR